MSLSVTPTSIDTYMAAGISALDSGDYATAKTAFEKAWAAAARMPDAGDGGRSTRWKPEAIKALVEHCSQQLNVSSGVGIQTSKITWANP